MNECKLHDHPSPLPKGQGHINTGWVKIMIFIGKKLKNSDLLDLIRFFISIEFF